MYQSKNQKCLNILHTYNIKISNTKTSCMNLAIKNNVIHAI